MHIICYELSIKDSGCGISPENIGRLFIDFSKMEESELLNKNGVGLGLSICKTLIENMAGSVNVQSKVGEGTTFTIRFKTTCVVTNAAQMEEINSNSSHKQSEKAAQWIDRQLQMWDQTESVSVDELY
jgi:K+-sensing histidine kinase KdpD